MSTNNEEMKVITRPAILSSMMMLLLMLMPLTVLAQHIGETEARRRAQAFLEQRGKTLKDSSHIKTAAKGRRAAARAVSNDYYLFNIGQGQGFVVVSGNERTTAILGYADSGSISEDDMPDGLRYLLDGYAEQMEWIETADNDNQCSRSNIVSAARTPISPLIKTRWNQGAPYNNYCPAISEKKTVTGCVATSMAQVMYYHQYPTVDCTAIPGYSITTKDADEKNYPLTVDELPATTFSWNEMTTTYADNASGEAANAVAKLMQYCGSSLQMKYGLSANGGSSAFNVSIAEALKNHFGYDGSASYVERNHYSYQDWVELIYTELVNNRPVVLGGQSAGGGHSFVCDGYDTDDYFHINWGWGGTSDGYFRLSILNPEEQGFGGSSSLDGFSFSQDAVIGIRPYEGTPVQDALQLESVSLDEGTAVTFTLCSYVFGTNNFDYAAQMVDGDGNVIKTLGEITSKSMTFNKNQSLELTSIDASEVADGTYYIKVVCRKTGEETWVDCYEGLIQQLTAVVSDGNVTSLTGSMLSGALPTINSITTSADPTVGYETEVTVSVTGSTTDYHGNLVLHVDGNAVQGKMADIPASQTVDVRFVYTPSKAGDNVLSLRNAKNSGTQLGSSTTITVAASDATDNVDLSFSATIHNLDSNGKLYGNALRATVTATNSSTEHSYVGSLNCSTRKWTVTDNGDNTYTTTWESLGVTHQTLVVNKNDGTKDGSTTLTFDIDDLPDLADNEYYSFRFSYRNTSVESKVKDAVHLGLDANEIGSLKVTGGYRLGTADGTVTVHPSSNSISAGDAAFVDLRGLTELDGVAVSPSSNPNCLYLLADGAATPSGLDDCNVVKGTTAETITLTDGHDFFSPISFTATTASYSRTFTLAANGTSGWNTLMLPFTVTAISCEDIGTVDWFHSATDTGKNFWLRHFIADADGTAVFDYADALTANTPYIIAVPDGRWGDKWQMTGRTVTFSGTDAHFSATTNATVSGNHYKFCGHTATTGLSDIYVLNAEGSNFVRTQETTSIEAFRAWLCPVSISSLARPMLSIASPETAAIGDRLVIMSPSAKIPDVWYAIDGRKLNSRPTAPGLYINNGKIIIIR